MKRFTFVVYVLFGALAVISGVAGLAALLFAQWGLGVIALVAAAILLLMARSIGNPYRQNA